jgi:hypothetical protein
VNVVDVLKDPLVSSLLGICGVVLAFVFYFRGRKIRRLSTESTSTVVVGPVDEANERLKIVFDGNEVPRVTRSVFVVWNSGHETIRGTDIATSDPLRVELPATTLVLGTNIERTTRSSVNFVLERANDTASVKLAFDFLDRNDGAFFSILHTAAVGEAKLSGTVQGIPAGVTSWDSMVRDLESYRVVRPRRDNVYWSLWNVIKRLAILCVLVFPPFLLFAGFFSGLVLEFVPSLGEPDTSAMLVAGKFNWIYIGFGGFFTFVEHFFIKSWWRRPPKKLVNPKISST